MCFEGIYVDIMSWNKCVIRYSSKLINHANSDRFWAILLNTYPDQWRHPCLDSLPSHSAGRPCPCLCSAAERSSDPSGLLRPLGSLSAALLGSGLGQSAPGWAGSSRGWAQCHYHCPGDLDIPEGCCFHLHHQCCYHQRCHCHWPRERGRDRWLSYYPLLLASWTGSPQYPYRLASGDKKEVLHPETNTPSMQWDRPVCFSRSLILWLFWNLKWETKGDLGQANVVCTILKKFCISLR